MITTHALIVGALTTTVPVDAEDGHVVVTLESDAGPVPAGIVIQVVNGPTNAEIELRDANGTRLGHERRQGEGPLQSLYIVPEP